MDNWQDYLEFGYDVRVNYEDDGVTVEDITLYPSIFVKDGYKIAKGDEKVELAFDAKYEWRYVFINKEDFTYEIGGICEGHDPYKDTVLDTFLGYHEEFDNPDYPEVHFSWLQGTVTTTAGYTEYTGDIPVEKLFHFGEKEEDGTTLYNIPAQMVPVITCTEASGKVAKR